MCVDNGRFYQKSGNRISAVAVLRIMMVEVFSFTAPSRGQPLWSERFIQVPLLFPHWRNEMGFQPLGCQAHRLLTFPCATLPLTGCVGGYWSDRHGIFERNSTMGTEGPDAHSRDFSTDWAVSQHHQEVSARWMVKVVSSTTSLSNDCGAL